MLGGGVDFSGLLGVVWGCLLCGGGGCRDSGRQEAGGRGRGGKPKGRVIPVTCETRDWHGMGKRER